MVCESSIPRVVFHHRLRFKPLQSDTVITATGWNIYQHEIQGSKNGEESKEEMRKEMEMESQLYWKYALVFVRK